MYKKRSFINNYTVKYLFYNISCILSAIIYVYTVLYVIYLCDLKGVFTFTITCISAFILLCIGLRKVHLLKKKNDTTFTKVWLLSNFISQYNYTMQVGEFQKFIGKPYHQCIFTKKDGTQLFVKFSPQLGELSPEEIIKRKDELVIGITISNKLYLHSSTDYTSWTSVNL